MMPDNGASVASHDETCDPVRDWVCVDCGTTWTGRNCGHEDQPTPIAVDTDGEPRCDACHRKVQPSPHRYTVQVYNGDVGGLDLDFYADTYEEAQAIARRETLPGTRGTEIIDEWVQHNDGSVE